MSILDTWSTYAIMHATWWIGKPEKGEPAPRSLFFGDSDAHGEERYQESEGVVWEGLCYRKEESGYIEQQIGDFPLRRWEVEDGGTLLERCLFFLLRGLQLLRGSWQSFQDPLLKVSIEYPQKNNSLTQSLGTSCWPTCWITLQSIPSPPLKPRSACFVSETISVLTTTYNSLQNHAEIKPMAELLGAYQHNEIDRFEKILNTNKKVIMDDPFIAQFISNVLREIRTQVLLEIIKPYTKVTIPFLAKVRGTPLFTPSPLPSPMRTSTINALFCFFLETECAPCGSAGVVGFPHFGQQGRRADWSGQTTIALAKGVRLNNIFYIPCLLKLSLTPFPPFF